jgi:hypothetical protein
MNPNSRLTRLERIVDGFDEAPIEVIPPDETARIIIYDPNVGPPEREPDVTRPWFCVPDNGRGPRS